MRVFWMFLIAALALSAQEPDGSVKFSVSTNLVIVNVGVRDKDGRPVEDLTAEDFEVIEDGDRQEVSVFEFQQLEPSAEAERPTFAERSESSETETEVEQERDITPSAPGEVRYRDKRLLVLYFDFSSMPPADQIRAQKAADRFLDEQMSPSDLVAVMVFSSRLQVLQDFTDNRELLRESSPASASERRANWPLKRRRARTPLSTTARRLSLTRRSSTSSTPTRN